MGDTRAKTAYLTRYLTRDFCRQVPSRVRLTSGRARNRGGNTRFMWASGWAERAWRLGCKLLVGTIFQIEHGLRRGWQWRWREVIFKEGCAALEQSGFDECVAFFEAPP